MTISATRLLKRSALVMLSVAAVALMGCAPEVGSDAWCESMKEKPKGDWTSNEAADFAKYCIFK
ncbi:DUF3012 domain-containing protein [Pseudomaricurvus hydrocarbonicus]|nr:DUF3012 domain-containing protein [Aestuariicella hydrocarbonica]